MGINFDIVQSIATLSTSIDKYGERWHNELNIISWNGAKPVFDIREWNEDHSMMHYGVRLDADEMRNLVQGMNARLKEYEAAQ